MMGGASESKSVYKGAPCDHCGGDGGGGGHVTHPCEKCGRQQGKENHNFLKDSKIKQLTKALEEIRSHSCVMGGDYGDSTIHKIAVDALKEE